jgi:hypothetical protein
MLLGGVRASLVSQDARYRHARTMGTSGQYVQLPSAKAEGCQGTVSLAYAPLELPREGNNPFLACFKGIIVLKVI